MEPSEAEAIVSAQRGHFESGATRDIEYRRQGLVRLRDAVQANRKRLVGALEEDMGKPAWEAYLADVGTVLAEIDLAVEMLEAWTEPRRVRTPPYLIPASSSIRPEPLGVALIIGPWNYPFDLVASPLIPALAAGNCAVVKPSELAPATAGVTAEIIASAFDPAHVTVVNGDHLVASTLLEQRFDHIFYTGSGTVGKIVMEAASKHLTPVTLELGGKSPCIVEPDVHVWHTARRIAWGKYFNAGQTCIAPDYLLVNAAVKSDLLAALGRAVKAFYGDDPAKSPDYARIVNERHFERVLRLIEGDVVVGGESDRDSLYIAPTIIDNVTPEHPAMAEEIFGPVLPVIEYSSLDEAIRFVNERGRPLSLYLFTRDSGKKDRVLAETSSGGVCVNDTMLHFSNSALPFGGVGASGFGKYHGRFGFDTFSNLKAVVERPFWQDVYVRYPPYLKMTGAVRRIIRHVF